MLLDEPLAVVLVLELEQGQAQLLNGGEVADPEQLLFQRPDEALRNSVALRLAHEGGAGLDAEKAQLGLVVVAHELAAVVVAELETGADLLVSGSKTTSRRSRESIGIGRNEDFDVISLGNTNS